MAGSFNNNNYTYNSKFTTFSSQNPLVEKESNHQESLPLSSQDKLKIMTTFSIPYDLVKNIANDSLADVDLIVPGETDIHSYSGPTSQKVQAIADSDILFAFGNPDLEPWLNDTLDGLGSNAPPIFYLINSSMYKYDPILKAQNPHVWMDPHNIKYMVSNITAELIKLDSTHQAEYKLNNNTYQAKLDSLIDRINANRTIFENKKAVINHPAYMYLLDLLGIERQAVIEEAGHETEASPEHIENIVNIMKNNHTDFIVTSPQVSNKVVYELSRQTGVKIGYLTPLLGVKVQTGQYINTYIDMIDYDLWALAHPSDPPADTNIAMLITIIGVAAVVVIILVVLRRR
ncbi:MAG: metal ABC transporter substrate-binding protein [Promethearchaeota archaeon]